MNEIPAQDALHIVKPFMLATNTSHSTLAHEVLCADTAGSSILVMNDTGMIIRRIGHLRFQSQNFNLRITLYLDWGLLATQYLFKVRHQPLHIL